MMRLLIICAFLSVTLGGCAVAAFGGGAVVQYEWDKHHPHQFGIHRHPDERRQD
jgi:hypothetical protein